MSKKTTEWGEEVKENKGHACKKGPTLQGKKKAIPGL